MGYTYTLRDSDHRERMVEQTGRTVDCTYDSNGNTKESQISNPQSEIVSLADHYDWRNRLIRREKSDGTIIQILYDGNGDRVRKKISNLQSEISNSYFYLVDRNNLTGYAQVVEEQSQGGQVEVIYTYGLDLISQDRRQEDGSFAQSYYLYDGLGSIRALTDDTGTITDEYTYDAWGVLLTEIPDTSFLTPNSYRFTGEQWDEDLEMYFLRARYLNVSTGRFHTMDTFEGRSQDPVTLHKYLYANANPASYLDPTGMFSLPSLSTVGAIIGNLARMAVVNVSRSIVSVGATMTIFLQQAFTRFSSTLQIMVARGSDVLTRGTVLLRSATGGWRLRILNLRGSAPRFSYEILNWKNVLRLEAHPINRNWPSWVYYPHGHVDLLGQAISKRHIPIIEPLVALASALWAFTGDEEDIIDKPSNSGN